MIGMFMMAGMGAMQMAGQRSAARTQARMEQEQHRIKMEAHRRGTMVNSLQNLLQNIEISRANQARWRQNRAIAKASNETRVLREGKLRRDSSTASINLSRGQNQALDSLTNAATGSNISPESGSFKAIKRAIQENSREGIKTLRMNDYFAKQNIIREQENALGRRDLTGYNQGKYYLGSPPPQLVQQVGTSALQSASAFLGGANQALGLMGGINKASGAGGGVNWFGS